jgi:hypothetical protein
MIFDKLLPQNELRDELMKNVFYQCCENVHLSGFIVSQFQHRFSDKSLKELFGKAAMHQFYADGFRIHTQSVKSNTGNTCDVVARGDHQDMDIWTDGIYG